jgi:hypothetical protein
MNAKFLVGIPTLNRYDCLEKLIESISNNSIQPEKILIIDNGGKYSSTRSSVEIIKPYHNLGVSASWNLLLKIADPLNIIICNDDITLSKDSLEKITKTEGDIILASDIFGFCCFLLKHHVWKDIGLFDESFYPGYYEDNDYAYRISLSKHKRQNVEINAKHVGSATINSFDANQRAVFNSQFAACQNYFIRKWGGLPGKEKFISPFNNMPSSCGSIKELRELCYARACATTSDINEHCPILYELAKECKHITEFGTSQGNSTIAFLNAQPKKLVCYNSIKPPSAETLRPLAEKTEFVFKEADILNIEIDSTDMLFTDTQHTYNQLSAELRLHSHKSKKYIIIHDTVIFGNKGENGEKGLWPAIEEFVKQGQFSIKKHYTNNNGLTILENNQSI